MLALSPAPIAWPSIFLESRAPAPLLGCLSLFPCSALEARRTFPGLPEASQLIEQGGPLLSLWAFREPIAWGNRELLPLHVLPRHCLAASPPQGGSLLFPTAPPISFTPPQRPIPSPAPENQAPLPLTLALPPVFGKNTCWAPGKILGAFYTLPFALLTASPGGTCRQLRSVRMRTLWLRVSRK